MDTPSGSVAVVKDTGVRFAELDPGLVRAGLFHSHLGHSDALPSLQKSPSVPERTRERQRSLEDAEHRPTEPNGELSHPAPVS